MVIIRLVCFVEYFAFAPYSPRNDEGYYWFASAKLRNDEVTRNDGNPSILS